MAKNWLINVSGRSAKKWLAYEVNIIMHKNSSQMMSN